MGAEGSRRASESDMGSTSFLVANAGFATAVALRASEGVESAELRSSLVGVRMRRRHKIISQKHPRAKISDREPGDPAGGGAGKSAGQ